MPFVVGDLIEIWSNSNHKWAPGTILDLVEPGKEVTDRGHPVPVGSLKVEYKGGPNSYACKWVLPGDIMRMVRYPKREGDEKGDKEDKRHSRAGAVNNSGAGADGKMRCKMNCGKYVQPGLTRNLNTYDSCCKQCSVSKGNGQHDANCQGAFVEQTQSTGRRIVGDGTPGWSSKDLQRILADPKDLAARAQSAISKFGRGGEEIRKEHCKEFFEWLTFKSCSQSLSDDKMGELFSQYAGARDSLNRQAIEKLIKSQLERTFNQLYAAKKLNLRRAMFVRKNNASVKNIYNFGKKIGEGSFGKVYLVEHQITKEKRVCKGINKKGSSVPIQQILDEIRIMSELDHPNVIKVYEYFDTPEALFMIMEVCAGGELLGRIKGAQAKIKSRGIEFHEKWIHDTMKQTLRALSFMHNRRVAHKDLKPENILYIDDTSNTIKVIDFGLAEWFKQSQRYSDLQCGTPLYCAPEIFSNSPFDFRVDIWSLGVIMYYMITGHLPFMGKDLPEVKGKVCGPDPPPTPQMKGVSPLMQDLCVSMLTKHAVSRPSAPQCLTHKWFVVMAQEETKLSPGIIQSLQNYNQQSELKKSIYFLVSHFCALPQLDQIRELFTNLDDLNDGTLNQTTLRDVLVRAGMCPHEAASVVHGISRNGNQLGAPIQYTEFIAGTASVRVSTKQPELLDFAFNNFDRNRTGVVTAEDFAAVLGDESIANSGRDNASIMSAFNEIDSEKSGKINKTQFHKYMKKLGKMGMGNDYSAV